MESVPLASVSTSAADQAVASADGPAFPHSISWIRTVLLSVEGVGSLGSLMAGNRLRSPARHRREAAAGYLFVPVPHEPAEGAEGQNIREMR